MNIYDVIVRDMYGLREEHLIDFDYGSFRYEFQQNNTRNIQFTIYLTELNRFSFDLLTTEATVMYNNQSYIVKTCVHNGVGTLQTKEITAHHVGQTCVNYVQRKLETGVKTYSIDEMLTHGFQGNTGDFTYKIHGSFAKQQIENLGRMTLMGYLQKAIEAFGAYVLADNKVWHVYSEDEFFRRSNLVLRYLYNTDTIKVQENTENLRTVIKAYGKKKENHEGEADSDYEAVIVYRSREAERYSVLEAVPVFNDKITHKDTLENWAKSQIIEVPEVSLEMLYLDDKETIQERDMLFFIHEVMGYSQWLKLNRLVKYHPFAQKPPELGFMSRPRDMVQIQQKLQRSVQESQKKISDSQFAINTIKDNTSTIYNDRIVAEVIEDGGGV